jgi:hypothetical protein
MTVPANVDHWLGNGPSGPFVLYGGDTVPPELESLAPDAWKTVTQAPKIQASSNATGPASSNSSS